MRDEVPRKEGRDHDTSRAGGAAFAAGLLLAALSAALPAPFASAQGAVPCTAIDDDDERLACYDRALRGTPPAAPAAPSRAARPAAVAPPAAAAPADASPRAEERTRERRVRESAAPAARAAPAAPTAGRDEGDQIVPLVIVGVRALPGREVAFTAEDGTTWVQTDSQRIYGLPEPPFEAELKPGAMGSHFLVPADRARAIRVREANR